MKRPPLKLHVDAAPRRRLLLALAGAGLLGGCGGGTDAGEAEPAAAQPDMHPLGIGAGGTGYRRASLLSASIGGVTPLIVGGVQLSGGTICDGDGQRLRNNELAPGMTARVVAGRIVTAGKRRVAPAQSVVVDTQVRGPAQWVDARTLLVLGRRVVVGSPTLPGLNGIGSGGTGYALKVWGQLDVVRNQVVASRVELAVPGEPFMLRGLLTAIDRATGVVQVGGVTARATQASPLPAGLAVGALARLVVGAQRPDGDFDLLALRDDALRPADGQVVELSGRVTLFTSVQRFELDGVPVDASKARIEGAAALAAGAAAEVAGTMRNGVLVAQKVGAEAAEPVEFEGTIDSVDAQRQLLTVDGLLLHWSAATQFLSSAARDLRVGRKVAGLARWVPGQVALEALRLHVEK